MDIKRKVNITVIILVGFGMPLYYKIKYMLMGELKLDQIFAIEGLLDILFGLCLAFLVIFGHNKLVFYLKKRLSISLKPLQRLVVQFILSIIYAIVITSLFAILFWEIFLGYPLAPDFLFDIALMSIMIPIIVNGITESVYAYGAYERELSQKQLLEQENVQTKYEVLKNQINPHFLFNSLNSLAILIGESKEKALLFLRKLSISYRFILESGGKELVALNQELHSLSAYIHLMEIRFGDKFSFTNSVPQELLQQLWVVPLSLQILLENALKHNRVGTNSLIKIELAYSEEKGLCFLNNKTYAIKNVNSTGLGLNNLKKRYAALAKSLVVENTEKFFEVRLPIIKTVV